MRVSRAGWPDPGTISISATYRSADDALCGSLKVPDALANLWTGMTYELTDAASSTWKVHWKSRTVACPSGEVVNVDYDAWSMFSACSGAAGPCHIEATTGGPCPNGTCDNGYTCISGLCVLFH